MRCLGAQFPQPLISQSAPSWRDRSEGREWRGVGAGGHCRSTEGPPAPRRPAQRRPSQKVAFLRRARALHQSPLPSVPVPPPSVLEVDFRPWPRWLTRVQLRVQTACPAPQPVRTDFTCHRGGGPDDIT
ncbi:unnamed protein product [Rangifer tarandus platyrhynchus]|uniref:Uncharacterized protein n=2 Tax=Rangifer tarandus platyrhynchus TaxID=3082113 RepID=A0ACB0F2S4_RANTA|nr:unnamed protein product [Rangifer tarandus platyrhynchus]CAI9706788.1 unnamed protein product [Rangifer tarandus platyrhynchus]